MPEFHSWKYKILVRPQTPALIWLFNEMCLLFSFSVLSRMSPSFKFAYTTFMCRMWPVVLCCYIEWRHEDFPWQRNFEIRNPSLLTASHDRIIRVDRWGIAMQLPSPLNIESKEQCYRQAMGNSHCWQNNRPIYASKYSP